MKNPSLYKSLHSLTRKSLELLEQSIATNLIVSTETEWTKKENDTYIRQEVTRPLWSIMFLRSKDEIKATQEFTQFTKVINEHKIISSQLDTLVGTSIASGWFDADNMVYILLSQFFADTYIRPFDEHIFKTAYLRIENALFSPDIEFERITPLCGFATDTREIALSPNLSIVELSDSEIITLLNIGINIGVSFGFGRFIYQIHKFAINFTYSVRKYIGDENSYESVGAHTAHVMGDLEHDTINALRLFKDGYVLPITTISKSDSIFPMGISYGHVTPVRPMMINKFHLIKEEKDRFIEFWKLYCSLDVHETHYLSVAIRRFSQANERTRVEDKIIDFFISAEALFLSSGGSFQGELKYRLSHRAAMFIESNAEKQREMFKFMQKAYDVRSAIVHGTAPKLPKKLNGAQFTLEEFCQEIEDCLRRSINKTIKIASTAQIPNNIIDWVEVVFPDAS